ncbi:hypothetical protein E6W36_02935 [Hankyongella ginsenosidimutans]|uniref:Imelysin-like domain-containing protein n=1 Tax=Hankyongella ginsenosidimutans TaxID=1763828 RepID=A0A4D7BTN4_9SPHN|nr:hypothetical protein [Hankyongella ginsenosidimutans]QCI78929.1 hypothetical protein E6W36_02935 [Hankyongella ginsenosidimutans]
MLDRLSIPHKLYCFCALSCAARRRRLASGDECAGQHSIQPEGKNGVDYLKNIWPVIDLATAQPPAARSSSLLTKAVEALEEGRTQYDGMLASGTQSKALADLLARWPQAMERNSRMQQNEAIAATITLIARVGDTSNLILDPDLDSYYTMDMVIAKLPTLVAALVSLNQSYRDYEKIQAAPTGWHC